MVYDPAVSLDPEQQKLYEEIKKATDEERSLLAQYAAATKEPDRNKLKESLSKVLDRQFDLQQQMRKRELDPIEARVKRLRELIDKRNQARKTIVEKRLDQLLRDAEGLGWNPPGEPAPKAGEPAPIVVVPPQMGPGATSYPMRERSEKRGAVTGNTWTFGDPTDPRLRSTPGANVPAPAGPAYTPETTFYPVPAKTALPVVEGIVLADPASGHIDISLGSNKGVSDGQRLLVYRSGPGGPAYVARVDVVKAEPGRAACEIIPEYQKEAIKKGDRVTPFPMVETARNAANTTQVKTFNLIQGEASSYAEILSVLPAVSEKRVQIAVDKRTNVLVANGPEKELLVIEALLLHLDTQKTPKTKAEDAKATKR